MTFYPHRFMLLTLLALMASGDALYNDIALAAKKYYPPGFQPDSTDNVTPETLSPQLPSLTNPQVIIKTVPRRETPKDPLTTMLQERRYYEAHRLLDKRLEASPNNESLRLLKAQVLREEESFSRSKAEYQAIINKSRSKTMQAKAWSGLGWTHLAHSYHAKNLGDVYGLQTYLNESKAAFQKAIQHVPKLPEAWIGLAQVALAVNNPDEAEVAIQKAGKPSSLETLVLLTRSRIQLEKENPDEALSLAYAARQKSPHDPKVYLQLAEVSLTLKRIDDAIIHLKKLLERSPDHMEGLKLLSLAYEMKMKPDDAEMVLQKAVSLNPADAEAALGLLKIYDQRQEGERAILALKTWLKSKPDQAVYQKELLERLLHANRWTEAFEFGQAFTTSAFSTVPPLENRALKERVRLFSRVAYHQGRRAIDKEAYLKYPAVTQSLAFIQEELKKAPQSPEATRDLYALLLLDPLAVSATGGVSLDGNTIEEIKVQLPVAFLQGQWEEHDTLLKKWNASGVEPHTTLQLAEELFYIRDYNGASKLLQGMDQQGHSLDKAVALTQQIAAAEDQAREKLKVLEMLPRKIPRAHWKEAATEALDANSSNWEVHVELAKNLEKWKLYEQALTQQELAALYAPNDRIKDKWQKRADKTRRKLEKED